MNRVDRILKYLDRDMDPEEIRSFEKDIDRDPGLRKELEDTRLVINAIGNEIQARDEEVFKQKLMEAMQGSEQKECRQAPPSRLKGRWWMAVAAAAILLALILVRHDKAAWEKYYHPMKDPVLLALDPSTRDGKLSFHSLLLSGKPEVLYLETSREIMEDSLITEASIFHLIAAIELGRVDEELEQSIPVTGNDLDVNVQVLRWYRALAFLRAGREDDAIHELKILTPLPGPYRSDAEKLLLLLTK